MAGIHEHHLSTVGRIALFIEPGSRSLRSLGRDERLRRHLIAWGLIGEPVPPVITSGGPQKKNS